MKYSRLNDKTQDHPADIENEDSGKERKDANQTNYDIRILFKEKAYQILGMTQASTVSALKRAVEQSTNVPVGQQRLIFAGRPLRNDQDTLASFSISAGSTIHLFPLPVASQLLSNSNSIAGASAGAATNPLVRDIIAASPFTTQHIAVPILATVYNDPFIQGLAREVKIWSLILIFLSMLTVLDDLPLIGTFDSRGFTTLTQIVVVLETGVSMFGLYVGNLGANCSQSLSLEDLTKHVKYVFYLAISAIVMRVLWVAEVLMDVHSAYRRSLDMGNDPPSSSSSNPNDKAKLASALYVQVVLVGLVCIFCWIRYAMQSYRLMDAVRSFHQLRVPDIPSAANANLV